MTSVTLSNEKHSYYNILLSTTVGIRVLCVLPSVCWCVFASLLVWPPAGAPAASVCACAAASPPSAARPAAGRSPAVAAGQETRQS